MDLSQLAGLDMKFDGELRQCLPDEVVDALRPPVFTAPREANANKSTGPRTAEGKAASSKNAIKHGLTARQVVIEGEEQADFDALHESIVADRKPVGELEIQFVSEIAACLWRLARGRAKESEMLKRFDFFTKPRSAEVDRLIRYMASIERQLQRAINQLNKLQAERRKLESSAPAPAAEPVQEEPKVMAAGVGAVPHPFPREFVSQNASPAVPKPPASADKNAPPAASTAPRAANSR